MWIDTILSLILIALLVPMNIDIYGRIFREIRALFAEKSKNPNCNAPNDLKTEGHNRDGVNPVGNDVDHSLNANCGPEKSQGGGA